MRDWVYLGTTPADEPCVQTIDPNYELLVIEECNRWIALLRETFGKEPEGAKLKVKWESIDSGRHAEVVCEFDDRYQESFDYAFRCESEAPLKWG